MTRRGPAPVGRTRELAEAAAVVEAAADGPVALVLEGDPGIGKSTVLAAAADAAEAQGARVLRCQGIEAEAFAHAGLADLLRPVDFAEIDLPAAQRHALEVATLRTDGDHASEVAAHAVGRGTLAVLTSLAARQRPLVLAVDDTQWLDAPSARALSFAAARLDAAPVALLLARRGRGPLPFGFDSALAPERRRRVGLSPLPDAEVTRLLVSAGAGGPALRASVRAAGGNPLFAQELYLAAREGRSRDDRLPPRIEDLLAERMAGLPPAAELPLAVVAELGSATWALVLDVCADPEGTADALAAALDAGLLLDDHGQLRFRHPLYGAAAARQLAPSVRRALHARLADIVTDPERRARHLARSATGPDADLAAAVELGARAARARGAPDAAAFLGDAALALTPRQDRVELTRRTVDTAYHHVMAGNVATGTRYLTDVLAECPPGSRRAELRWRAAMLRCLGGDFDSGIADLKDALTEAQDDATRLMILQRLGGMSGWSGDFVAALGYLEQTQSLRRSGVPAEDDGRAVDALHLMYKFRRGEADTRADLAAMEAALAQANNPPAPHQDPEMMLIPVRLGLRGPDAARACPAGAMAPEAADEDPLAFAWRTHLLATVEVAAGRLDVAERLAADGLRAISGTEVAAGEITAQCARATVLAAQGSPLARAQAEAALALAERIGTRAFALEARAALVAAAVVDGDLRTALENAAAIDTYVEGPGTREPTVAFLRWCAGDALVAAGEPARAAAMADRLEALGRALDRPYAFAVAATLRGRIAGANGDPEAGAAAFEAAYRHHEQLGWPFERARTLLAHGSALRRWKQKRAARDRLVEAERLFDGMGAPGWAALARTEQGRIGGRQSSGAELTTGEQAVADLVGEGLTNREIADRLYLSPATVAAHLTRAYGKLGVRSRTELARLRANGRTSADSTGSTAS